MLGLHPADLAALLLYFVVVTCIGVWAARRVKSMSDYVLPRRFGKLLMIFFGFGTGTHSDQAVSVASKSYTNGISGIWYQWLYLFATPFYWLIAPMMRRFRAITTADVFELRYDRSVAMLFAVVGLMQYTVNIGVMLKGSAHVIEASTGGSLNANWAIAVMTLLFVVYGIAGGLHAAVLTDFIQGVLTIAFSFMLLPFVLNAIGGLAGLHQQVPEDMLSMVAPGEITAFYVAVIAINGLVGIVTQPHTMANCAAGRTEMDGQVGWMCGNFLKRFCTVAWALTGVAAVAYFAARNGEVLPDNVFGQIAREFLPDIMPGLLGLFLAGLLASVMSSCDAFMISTAGLFTENLYKPFVPKASERHYLWVARLSSLGVVAAGVIFAYSLENVPAGLEIFWKIAPMLGIAFWLGLFWRRMTVVGAWVSTLTAFGVWWLTTQGFFIEWVASLPITESWRLVFRQGDSVEIYLPWQMILYLTLGLTSGIVASLLSAPVPEKRLDRFYELVRTPVLEEEAPSAPCTLPAGVKACAARKLLPIQSLEIYVPSRRSIIGFVIGWMVVLALIGTVMALLR